MKGVAGVPIGLGQLIGLLADHSSIGAGDHRGGVRPFFIDPGKTDKERRVQHTRNLVNCRQQIPQGCARLHVGARHLAGKQDGDWRQRDLGANATL